MSDTENKQAPSVVKEPEIPSYALVESGAISRSELTRRRKDYAIWKLREKVGKGEVMKQLGMHRQTFYDWLEHDKEFRDRILRMKSLIALGMIPKAMKTLEDSMDAMDGETRRKAANDILDHAEGRRSREAGVTINADKVTFNSLSSGDLVGLLKGLGLDLKDQPVAEAPKEIEAEIADADEAEQEIHGAAGDPTPEPEEPDPPPTPEVLPPVVLPAVPPADPAPNPEKMDPPEEEKDGDEDERP